MTQNEAQANVIDVVCSFWSRWSDPPALVCFRSVVVVFGVSEDTIQASTRALDEHTKMSIWRVSIRSQTHPKSGPLLHRCLVALFSVVSGAADTGWLILNQYHELVSCGGHQTPERRL